MMIEQKYVIEPSSEQCALFKRYAGSLRFVWNNTLQYIRELASERVVCKTLSDGTDIYYPGYDALCVRLKELCEEFVWLNNVPIKILQEVLVSLDAAYQDELRGNRTPLDFESRYTVRISFSEGVVVNKHQREIDIPNIGSMKIRIGWDFRGGSMPATVYSYDHFTLAKSHGCVKGRWYVSFGEG